MLLIKKKSNIPKQHEMKAFPQMRYMGSKHKLIEWIDENLKNIEYDSVLDAFSGSGVMSYYFKQKGKQVFTNDFLNFPHIITKATVENQKHKLSIDDIKKLLSSNPKKKKFIEKTFSGIFFNDIDLRFLDLVISNLYKIEDKYKRSIALSALIRSCVKKQPRGVFTISSYNFKHHDGRRDLKLSIQEHFIEQIQIFNDLIFNNKQKNKSFTGDIFDFNLKKYPVDMVYLDPPYVPMADDNCYIKRYHFLEGLSNYWENMEILESSKVKKLKKKFTPFSYKATSVEAFDNLFKKFKDSKIVLSYSSNAYPTLDIIVKLMEKYKSEVKVSKKEHRYHFGNHASVTRAIAEEYLIIGV
jgi:adenine-specific DNA-methyltransferase